MSGGIQRGYGEINEKNEEIRRRREADRAVRVPELFLPVGGIAKIRLLTEPICYNAHKLWDPAKRKNYFRYCTIDDDTEGEVCQYCNQGMRTSRFFMFWIYCYFKLQSVAGQYGEWKAVNYQNKKMFQQMIERPMFLRRGVGKGNAMFEKFTSYFLEYGTWTDRDYMFRRNEEKEWNKTDYFLTPKDAEAMSAKLAMIVTHLPDLVLVATGQSVQLPKFDDSGNPIKEEPKEESVSAEKTEKAQTPDVKDLPDEEGAGPGSEGDGEPTEEGPDEEPPGDLPFS